MGKDLGVPNGDYFATPLDISLMESKSGNPLLMISLSVDVGGRFVEMASFNNLHTEQSVEYARQNAERVGVDVSQDVRKWKVDSKNRVRVRVVTDEYGTKIKSIFGVRADLADKVNAIFGIKAATPAQANKITEKADHPTEEYASQSSDDDVPF